MYGNVNERRQYPAILRPVEGIQIIEGITAQPGVHTLEGKIGPLIRGKGCQSHFIDLPPGLYTEEHPYQTESIIFTVRGRWVLCSQGRRHLMRPGTLFWFGPDVPTGYEVPFDEPAYILIFKGELLRTAQSFLEYLREELAPRLTTERDTGKPFYLGDLAEDHPARVFARSAYPQGRW